jgi:hypothetical protein
MRLRIRNRRLDAMTAFEVMVVIVCLLIAAVILFQIVLVPQHTGRQRTNCVSNLRQVNIAFRIWEGDNGNQYPMSVSVTNGGGMELIEAGNLTGCLQCASNEMSTTKIFICPNDSARTFATNWNDLNRLHVSYFISPDANEEHPATILDGDDNLVVGGVSVASGLVNLSSNAPVSWSGARHGGIFRPHFWSSPKTNGCGNLGFADGSVSQTASHDVQWAFQGTGLATNRIVIP